MTSDALKGKKAVSKIQLDAADMKELQQAVLDAAELLTAVVDEILRALAAEQPSADVEEEKP